MFSSNELSIYSMESRLMLEYSDRVVDGGTDCDAIDLNAYALGTPCTRVQTLPYHG